MQQGCCNQDYVSAFLILVYMDLFWDKFSVCAFYIIDPLGQNGESLDSVTKPNSVLRYCHVQQQHVS